MSTHVHAPLTTVTDAELVSRAQARDAAAIAEIVTRYRPALLSQCRRRLPHHDAEDAVQLALIRALRALASGAEVRELGPWLRRITENVCNSKLSSTPCEMSFEDQLQLSAADQLGARAELRDALVVVSTLPERQRQRHALLRAAAGQNGHEIATGLGISEPAVRQLVSRARATVRAAVHVIVPTPLLSFIQRVLALGSGLPAPLPALEPLLPKMAVVAAAAVATVLPISVTRALHTDQPPGVVPAHVAAAVAASSSGSATPASVAGADRGNPLLPASTGRTSTFTDFAGTGSTSPIPVLPPLGTATPPPGRPGPGTPAAGHPGPVTPGASGPVASAAAAHNSGPSRPSGADSGNTAGAAAANSGSTGAGNSGNTGAANTGSTGSANTGTTNSGSTGSLSAGTGTPSTDSAGTGIAAPDSSGVPAPTPPPAPKNSGTAPSPAAGTGAAPPADAPAAPADPAAAAPPNTGATGSAPSASTGAPLSGS